MEITIRKGTQEDHEWIADSQINLADESEGMALDRPTVLRGVQHILDNPQIGHYLICEIGGKPAGMLMLLREWSDWRCGDVLWIHSVFVYPEFRRQGVYRKMYAFVQEEVRSDDNLMGIRLFVDKTNTKAIETYNSLGMNGEHYHLYEWMKNG